MKKYQWLIIGSLVALFFVAGFVGFQSRQEKPAVGKADNETVKNAGDLIGSHTATSTPVGVNFSNPNVVGNLSVSSSYIKKIGNANTAIITVKIIDASTTSKLFMDVEGSSDDECDTTATSGGNSPLITEINWFNAGENFANRVQSVSWTNSSSTQTMSILNPTIGTGHELILTNLAYQCLRATVRGASTTIWSQIQTR